MGFAKDKRESIDVIARHLGASTAQSVPVEWVQSEFHPIGHGEIPPGTPQPYYEFSEDHRRLLIHTPFTPRPYDHTLSNALGHAVVVTNRGLHTTSSVNSQQNRLTPDWSDTATREVPAEAFYLYDPDTSEWFSPTYHPLNDARASHEAEFSVDGSATFRMRRGDDRDGADGVCAAGRAGGRLLAHGKEPCGSLRGGCGWHLISRWCWPGSRNTPARSRSTPKTPGALFFENPRNTFRTGPAFVAISCPVERMETQRGRFFGEGRGVAHPYLVERGEPDTLRNGDNRPIAALLTTLNVPAHGERTVVVVLGQADDRARAEAVIRKYQDLDAALASLQETRRWWLA